MNWKQALQEREKIVMATSSPSGEPRAIPVVSLGFVEEKLLIGACLMRKSFQNLKENNRVSIVTMKENGYFRIKGFATIYSQGEYLQLAIKKSNPPLPYAAIVIEIKEVIDLDSGKRII